MSAIAVTNVATCPAPSSAEQLRELQSFLADSEIITPGHKDYEAASSTWSHGKNLHPKLIVQPEHVDTLKKVVKFLAQSVLDFNIRTR
jgi:hypothetical protein